MPDSLAKEHDTMFQKSALYQEFLAEREEILRHKWIESEKVGHDIGFEKALLDWIVKHRAGWRALRQHRPTENRDRANNVAAA
ncbi:MAG: DUF4032 domain-containing protein [Methylacidiphilales bacterium]|nr:DUF4032 domain-containing protein [Candidatus Methylacidiphilales bacterium]